MAVTRWECLALLWFGIRGEHQHGRASHAHTEGHGCGLQEQEEEVLEVQPADLATWAKVSKLNCSQQGACSYRGNALLLLSCCVSSIIKPLLPRIGNISSFLCSF